MDKKVYPLVQKHIPELSSMKKYPDSIYCLGDTSLLAQAKISIVGSRRPISYTKNMTHTLARKLSLSGYCIVSGAAMGVDAIAHKAAGAQNTIAVLANGLDIRYPAVNKALIEDIEKNGLLLSTYESGAKATRYSFVHRNELVVALGEKLIVTQADLKSGSLRSVEYALRMGKEIYVLPHRILESQGTNELVKKGLAKVIYDIDEFINDLGVKVQKVSIEDDFLDFAQGNPTYDEAVEKFGHKVFEYELLGKINIVNGTVTI
ncbi:MAG: DNA-processing protein DprA [Campylobacterota bacterium]|nr:DNA-processing protein DprA [Campylobacterota bacterium]